ncbi:hypothetical protein OF83DRAFT_1080127 [Amylostereum chailletii]|nr:hypothetical protein OF83DRAFT_1080127 [Amylostereum chailletii]
MVGANYMGGKRNMAKSRSKDWTGKAQKNHFGTQRIAVLQKGLSGTSQHQSVLNTTSSGPSAINLGHMARDSDLMGSQQPSSTDCPMVLPHMSPSHTTAMDASHANSDQESMKHISKSILALDALGGKFSF